MLLTLYKVNPKVLNSSKKYHKGGNNKMINAKEIIKKKIDRIKKSLIIGKMLESQAGEGVFKDIDEKEIFCIEILEEILEELK